MFSVVIPLYNKEKYIRATVESVLAQDYKDFEIIIVNDGSTDASLNKIKDISDARVKIINQDNAGVGAARNNGMSHANFEWIAFLDGDDLWAPNHLSEIKKVISMCPTARMVATNYKSFYTDLVLSDTDELEAKISLIDYFLQPIVWTSATAINKKYVFETLGGFSDYSNGEDLEYWVRIALDYPVAISNRVTAYYRLATGGITDTYAREKGYSKEIKLLSDISPSIELLVNRSKDNPSILRKSNIRFYINSRLWSGAKAWLSKDNVYMAKQLANFGFPQLNIIFFLLVLIKVIPTLGLQKIISIYKKVKKNA